jgi:electron transport complex protein RnfE
MASVRELLGNGTIFNIPILPEGSTTILIFILPPGAFITYGYLIAIMNRFKAKYN